MIYAWFCSKLAINPWNFTHFEWFMLDFGNKSLILDEMRNILKVHTSFKICWISHNLGIFRRNYANFSHNLWDICYNSPNFSQFLPISRKNESLHIDQNLLKMMYFCDILLKMRPKWWIYRSFCPKFARNPSILL